MGAGLPIRLAARAVAIALILAWLALLAGCVFRDHHAARSARDAYHACRAQHPTDAAQCDPEWQRYLAAVERYEENSRRAWGCDAAQEECPSRR